MANEKLTITRNNARLSVIGRSYADTSTNSGDGDDITQEIIDWLDDHDIPVPPFPPDDWDDIDIIIGLDDDDNPILIYIDPDTGDIEEWPLDDLDWDDFLQDFDGLDWEMGSTITTVNEIVTIDENCHIVVENIPVSIEIVTPPKKLVYVTGKPIDLTGMVVTAKKSDGSTWTSAKYPNGHVPLQELIMEPNVAVYSSLEDIALRTDRCSSFSQNRHFTATASGGAILFINRNDELVMAVTFLSEHKGACGTFNNSPAYANTLIFKNGNQEIYMSNTYNYSHNCTESLNPYYKEYIALTTDEVKKLVSGVTVIWRRPGDGMELKASFAITIAPKGNGGR